MQYDAANENRSRFKLLGEESFETFRRLRDKWKDRLLMVQILTIMNLRTIDGIEDQIHAFLDKMLTETEELLDSRPQDPARKRVVGVAMAYQLKMGLTAIDQQMEEQWGEFRASIMDLGVPHITPLSLEEWRRKADGEQGAEDAGKD